MKILRRSEVVARVGLSSATIYRLISRDMFPRSVQLSVRAKGWRSDEVEEWLVSRPHTVPESPGRAKEIISSAVGPEMDTLDEISHARSSFSGVGGRWTERELGAAWPE